MSSNDPGAIEYRLARLRLKEGDLQSAFELAHRATEKDPHNGLFIGLLGEICYSAEAWTDARSFLELALRINPNLWDLLLFLGHSYRKLDQPDEATRCYQRILLGSPRHLEALMGLGNVSRDLGHLQDALDYYGQCLDIEPEHTACLVNRGLCNLELEKFEDAVEDLKACLKNHTKPAIVIKNLARAFSGSKDYLSAIEYFRTHLEDTPEDHLARYQLACCHAELKQVKDAVSQLDSIGASCIDLPILRQAATLRYRLGNYAGAKMMLSQIIAIDPNDAVAHVDLALTLRVLGSIDEAFEYTLIALRLDPTLAMIHVARALLFISKEQFSEASRECELALAIDNESFDAHANLAFAQLQLLELESAAVHFQRALAIKSENADIQYNYALFLLLTGRLRDGFRYYESRWQRTEIRYLSMQLPGRPLAAIHNLQDKTIFICAEQGFGDSIQFLRYLNELEKHHRHTFLGVQKALVRLLKYTSLRSSIIPINDFFDEFIFDIPIDYSCRLLSLPHLFESEQESLPPPLGIQLPSESVELWKRIVGAKQKPAIGLVWQGSKTHLNDKNRSISLESLCNYLPGDFAYVSLQKEISDEDLQVMDRFKIKNFRDELTDFMDTALLCKALDLVITVDTSVAHLAGSLGVQTWVLLPRVPDWRWGLSGDVSAWYPTVKLLRQSAAKDWNEVFLRLKEELHRRFDSREPIR